MTALASTDAVIDGLTSEQRVAAATTTRSIFIEAGPGTGKTTRSAHRLGVAGQDVDDGPGELR
jgi:DNA helicase-2/ATP-dependent DNA helicase PcrA